MFYNIGVKIIDSPTKVKEWRFLTFADTKEEADEMALSFAKEKALRPYSRYKRCSFEVEKEDNQIGNLKLSILGNAGEEKNTNGKLYQKLDSLYERLDNLEGCEDNQVYVKEISEIRSVISDINEIMDKMSRT